MYNKMPNSLRIDFGKNAAETGIILHRCFEVLTGQEDRINLLNNATGYEFTKKQQQELQQAVTAFENWCHEQFGDIKLHKEIPITYTGKSRMTRSLMSVISLMA